mgnify:CR=1 FL=1
MQKNKDRIRDELRKLIVKSNDLLNSGQNRQRVTAYLYVIFSLITLSFFGLFAIGPTITTITELNKQYKEESEALKQLKTKNAALKSLSEKYLDIQPDLQLIDGAIPQKAGIAQLTRQIEQLTIDHELIMQKLDTGLIELYPAKNPNSSIYSFTFSVGVSGEEQNVNAFISNIINMRRIIGIEKLTTGKKQDNSFSASITGRAFFFKE